MATYWVTFRIADKTVDGETYATRHKALTDTINLHCSNWWVESTSFLLFESKNTLDQLAGVLKASVSDEDLFLIRACEGANARIYGNVSDDDVFTLMPYLKYA